MIEFLKSSHKQRFVTGLILLGVKNNAFGEVGRRLSLQIHLFPNFIVRSAFNSSTLSTEPSE